jgi:hypothetical protein
MVWLGDPSSISFSSSRMSVALFTVVSSFRASMPERVHPRKRYNRRSLIVNAHTSPITEKTDNTSETCRDQLPPVQSQDYQQNDLPLLALA